MSDEKLKELQSQLESIRKDIEAKVKDKINEIDILRKTIENSPRNYTFASEYSEIIDEMTRAKRAHTEEMTNLSAESKKNIATLLFQNSEYKKSISKLESDNALLILENIDLKKSINDQNERNFLTMNGTSLDYSHFKSITSSMLQKLIKQHQQMLNNIDVQKSRIDLLDSKLNSLNKTLNFYGTKNCDLVEEQNRYRQYIEHLIRSLGIISDIQDSSCPDVDTVLSNKSILDNFISSCYEATKSDSSFIHSKPFTGGPLPRAGRASPHVARVLNDLGALSTNLAERLEEENAFMRDSEDISTDFLTESLYK